MKYFNENSTASERNKDTYPIPSHNGCTITTNVPPKETAFAHIGNDGKLLEFNMDMTMAGAQEYVNGNSTPTNMSCLLIMSVLDAIVSSSHNYTTLEEFREHIKRFKI